MMSVFFYRLLNSEHSVLSSAHCSAHEGHEHHGGQILMESLLFLRKLYLFSMYISVFVMQDPHVHGGQKLVHGPDHVLYACTESV